MAKFRGYIIESLECRHDLIKYVVASLPLGLRLTKPIEYHFDMITTSDTSLGSGVKNLNGRGSGVQKGDLKVLSGFDKMCDRFSISEALLHQACGISSLIYLFGVMLL